MTKTSELALIDPASVSSEKIAGALRVIQLRFTRRQREALFALHLAPNHELLVDDRGQYSNVINAFGKIGGLLSRELGFKPDGGYHLLWIATQINSPEDGKRYWRMNPNFSAALAIASLA